jgi:hypothetical protein
MFKKGLKSILVFWDPLLERPKNDILKTYIKGVLDLLMPVSSLYNF